MEAAEHSTGDDVRGPEVVTRSVSTGVTILEHGAADAVFELTSGAET